jgi:raffinose/stachyose/melibiose transport system permease protein
MNDNKTYSWHFAIGAVVLYFVFFFLPGLIGIGLSFTDWNIYFDKLKFVGLENYKKAFTPEYTQYIGHTIYFTIVTTLLKTVIGIALALLMIQSFIWAKNVQRMVIFTPQVMSYLVVGLVFKSMLHPTRGFLNNALRAVGLDSLAKNWLTDLSIVFPTVMVVDTWKGVGYIMVVVIAGLLSISDTYYEAAEIDGANFFQKFTKITLPLLLPIIVNITVLNVTYGLRVFDMVYSLTNGGPGNATGVINTAVYKEFSKGNLAMGTTLSNILFIILIAMVFVVIKSMENKEVQQ